MTYLLKYTLLSTLKTYSWDFAPPYNRVEKGSIVLFMCDSTPGFITVIDIRDDSTFNIDIKDVKIITLIDLLSRRIS
jgi:hypothetical protein